METARTLNGSNGAAVRAGIAYMVAGFAVILLMGLLGLVMRLTHGGTITIAPAWFYRIMTLHGAGMIAASLLVVMGGFAAVLSRTVRLSTRWLWIGWVVSLLGVVLVVAATLLGGFGGAWTVLHPLPFEGQVWSRGAALTMYTGYLCVALGFLAYCGVLLTGTVRARGGLGRALAWRYLFSGGKDTRDLLPTPVELAGTTIALDGIFAVLAGAVYLVPLYAEAFGWAPRADALFAKNVLFIFGHTLANLTIYLAAGLVYTLLPAYTGREWKTTWPIVLAWNLVIFLILMPVFHHLYQDFAQPEALALVGQIGSWAVSLPAVLVTILGALALIYGSRLRWAVPSVLVVLGLWGWVVGGVGALLDSAIGVNQVMHNTLWVPAHFHTYYVLGAVAFGIAYFYHLLAELSGARERQGSRVAAWLYGIGGAGFALMFFLSGADSVPRRFAAHLPEWQRYARWAVPFVLLIAAALLWLTLDMIGRLAPAWRRTRAES